jgi:type II secretion system protein H
MKMTSKTRASSGGFTLIELVAVMTILAILAGAVSLSLRGPYQTARLENAVERLTMVDRQMREHARRYGRSEQLTICPNTGQIAAVAADGQPAAVAPFRLDAGITIGQVATAEHRSDCDEVVIILENPRLCRGTGIV